MQMHFLSERSGTKVAAIPLRSGANPHGSSGNKSLSDPRAHVRDLVAVEDLDSANVHAVAANSAGPPLLVM